MVWRASSCCVSVNVRGQMTRREGGAVAVSRGGGKGNVAMDFINCVNREYA